MSHEVLDARRLLCPMPVIKTQNRINNLHAGDTLCVIATDPGVMEDIPAWCRIHGHSVTNVAQEDNEISITIKVGV